MIFIQAVEQAGLAGSLDGPNPYTVLHRLCGFSGVGRCPGTPGNRQELAQIIQYHMHHGVLDSAEIRGRNQVATVGG